MSADAANVVLGAITERVITPVVHAIGRQFGYLFCYKTNINNLAKTAAQIEKSGKDADNLFQRQRRNNEEPAQSSVGWLDDVQEMIKDAKQVKEATDKLNGCLNLKSRYVLSRKSTKLAAEIQKLKSKAPQGITKNNVLPAGRLPGASANEASKGYKTRMETLKELMYALEDPAISVIGLCGLGGVGKTTMVHEVRDIARKKNMFDEFAMTTVSQNQELSKDQELFKIQGDLAEMLDLKSIKEKENVIARADQLNTRLSSGNKVLIILDDVWSDIDLKQIGIPFGSEHTKCKVLITSRQEGVCTHIQKNIKVHALAKEEARAMFRETVGEHVEKKNLGEIADEIADECGGLPIALLTLSRALSNKDRKTWEDARAKLREGHFTDINGMEKHVYQSIRLSYDFLAKEKLEEAQSLLLLCCQHQEDAEINLEKLARYCMALDLFKGVTGVVRATNRVYSLVEHLKSCFLLQAIDDDDDDEDGDWSKKTVKVHDVVRDVCLSIVSTVKEERDRVYLHIWNKEDDAGVGSTDLDYQKLKLLMEVPLHTKDLSGIISVLEQTQELRVLESAPYFWNHSEQNGDPSLAPQFLTNLRMLSLEHIFVGPGVMSKFIRQTEMEILSFRDSVIVSFPHQIGQLSKLKLLDLRCRYEITKSMIPIPSGILTKLTKLEVLFLGNHYFPEAPYYGGEDDVDIDRCPARIEELDSLTNLTTLQVDLVDPMQLLDLKNLRFEKLEGFSFGFAGKLSSFDIRSSSYPLHMKSVRLKKVGMEWVLEHKVQSIVRSTVDLSLEDIEDLTDTSIFKQFASLRNLVLRGCHQLEYIIHDGSSAAFMNLETLSIDEMRNVRELCHNGHLPAGSLHKLKRLRISSLPEMRHLWVGHTDPFCLDNLKVVEIEKCGALKCIFPHSAAKRLSQLQSLSVGECGMLEGIVCKGEEGISTERCGEITEEPNDLLKEVINKMNEEEKCDELENKIVFRSLRNLKLEDLKNLSSFCSSDRHVFEFPSLEMLIISCCPELRTFCFQGTRVAHSGMLDEYVSKGEEITTGAGALCDLAALFPKLKQVYIDDTPKFRGFDNIDNCEGHQNLVNLEARASYQLKQMVEEGGDNLVKVAASSSLNLVQNLKHISLEKCEAIKSVLDFEGFDVTRDDAHSVFNKLKTILLWELSNLEHICRLIPKEINGFQNLRKLEVWACQSLSYLLTSTMAHMLLNLKFLRVWNCKSMKEIVKTNDDCGEDKIVFRSLHHLEFLALEKLASFCSSELQEFDFPSLKIVIIHTCPAMTTFCCGHLTAEKLQGVYFNDKGYIPDYHGDVSDYHVADKDKVFWKGDVNETIRHFSERANRMERDLKEDGVDENDNDDDEAKEEDVYNVGDKRHPENDLNETTQHLNSSDLNEDEIDDFVVAAAADDDDDEDGDLNLYEDVDEKAQGDNEERYEAIVRQEAASKFEKLSQRLDAQLMEMQGQMRDQFSHIQHQLSQTHHQLSQTQHQLSQVLTLLRQQTGNTSDGDGHSGT